MLALWTYGASPQRPEPPPLSSRHLDAVVRVLTNGDEEAVRALRHPAPPDAIELVPVPAPEHRVLPVPGREVASGPADATRSLHHDDIRVHDLLRHTRAGGQDVRRRDGLRVDRRGAARVSKQYRKRGNVVRAGVQRQEPVHLRVEAGARRRRGPDHREVRVRRGGQGAEPHDPRQAAQVLPRARRRASVHRGRQRFPPALPPTRPRHHRVLQRRAAPGGAAVLPARCGARACSSAWRT